MAGCSGGKACRTNRRGAFAGGRTAKECGRGNRQETGADGGTRTHYLSLRRAALYPDELRPRKRARILRIGGRGKRRTCGQVPQRSVAGASSACAAGNEKRTQGSALRPLCETPVCAESAGHPEPEVQGGCFPPLSGSPTGGVHTSGLWGSNRVLRRIGSRNLRLPQTRQGSDLFERCASCRPWQTLEELFLLRQSGFEAGVHGANPTLHCGDVNPVSALCAQ